MRCDCNKIFERNTAITLEGVEDLPSSRGAQFGREQIFWHQRFKLVSQVSTPWDVQFRIQRPVVTARAVYHQHLTASLGDWQRRRNTSRSATDNEEVRVEFLCRHLYSRPSNNRNGKA